ncbi:MAG: hypothetical protein M0P61_08280 [Ignavibacteriaceae bacterium]|nr:hypothetical protein [Ignavibacteriaceae bacterium]
MNFLKKLIPGKSLKYWFLFLYFVSAIGFVIGSLLFWGPIRWTIDYFQGEGASEKTESLIINVFIVLILLLAGSISFFISRRYWESEKQSKKWVIYIPAFFFAAVLFLWMNPQYIPGKSERSEKISLARISFVFGPYPSKEQIIQLKKEKFSGIISLLHPAVIPFEPKLIYEEDAAAKDAGIEIIHAPMLPWVSQNISSIETIKKLLATGKGKYFVHCYLGKDRVNVVRRIIESQNVSVDANNINTYRTLNEIKVFAEGPLFYLGKAVYLLPHPSEEECLGYLLSGYVKQVVSLIDDASSENLEITKKDSALYSTYAMDFIHHPFDLQHFDYTKLSEILNPLSSLPKPLVLIIKTTKPKETGMLVQAIKSTFSINKLEIENIFKPEKVERVYPNIFYGPVPDAQQSKRLSLAGIYNLVFLSPKSTAAQIENESGIKTHFLNEKGKLDSLLFNDTWYLCGVPFERTGKLFSY